MAAWETGINSGQVVLVWLPVHRPGCHVEVRGSKLEIFGLWARDIAGRRVNITEHLKIKYMAVVFMLLLACKSVILLLY